MNISPTREIAGVDSVDFTTKKGRNSGSEKDSATIHIVLPAYNEEEALPYLLKRFIAFPESVKLEIWVINDGSTDATVTIPKTFSDRLNIHLISHQTNMGLGQTLHTGLRSVLKNGAANDCIIVMDADDTHDVALIQPMYEGIQNGADIVIASRFIRGGNDATAPLFRRLLSRGASFVFKTLLPLDNIDDFTSGYRAYRIELLKHAVNHWGERLIEEKGFACMVELLLKLRYWKPVITEIPFTLRYDRKRGASKLKLVRTLLQYLKLAIRDRLVPPPVRVEVEESTREDLRKSQNS